jgi:succinate dehydrogenase / fumarate reductase cytochrome b subunit
MSVYRMYRYSVLSSITNRITGLGLSVGLVILVYWLMAIASGTAAYERALAVLSLPIFKVIYGMLFFTFAYHLVAGVRHLIWDTGHGLERAQSQRSAWLVGTLSVLFTIGLIYWAFCPGAHQ